MKKTIIIGGGPSGLAAAYALQRNTVVLGKENTVGGLCRSVERDGGVFDIGGHSFHTPFPEVYELVSGLLGDGLYEQGRDARVHTHGQLIPYPFQKHFDRIPDLDVVRECEEGLLTAEHTNGEAQNFEEYIVNRFGPGIARHFMLPYNRKLWARDIRRISCEWTSERVAAAKGESESFERAGGQRKPLQANTSVGYPAKGGFEEIFKSLAARIPGVELNCDVTGIDPKSRTVRTSDGRVFEFDVLVSTMPLPELLKIVDGAPKEMVELSERLEYMSLRVQLLLAGRQLDAPQRIYVSDPDIPPHKIAFNNNSSEFLRAQPHHAITAEVSYSDEKPVNGEEMESKTIDFLCDQGFLDAPEEIIWRGDVDVKYAYPVYTHDRPQILIELKDWLAKYRIHTLGRFGDWEYINSDKCLMKGLRVGEELQQIYPELQGSPTVPLRVGPPAGAKDGVMPESR